MGIFKRKTDKPCVREIEYKVGLSVPVDSSVPDDELASFFTEKFRSLLEVGRVEIVSCTRSGAGEIEQVEMGIRFPGSVDECVAKA